MELVSYSYMLSVPRKAKTLCTAIIFRDPPNWLELKLQQQASQLNNQPTNQRTNQPTNQSSNQPTNRQTKERKNERTNQRTNEPTNETNDRTTEQPTTCNTVPFEKIIASHFIIVFRKAPSPCP